ncbi:MAG: CpsB/CapC family capsule biosynthesis tyrosine phosphatase [Bacteroidota bacterium]
MAFLKNIFRRKEELNFPQITDYSAITVDMHSHLIPGIDDGSKTIEESIALIKRYIALGYKKLITTPHIMSDAYRNTPEIILGGLDKLREAVKREGLTIELDASAEYYLDEDFSRLIKEKKLLSINGKYILFEVSYMNAPDNIGRVIFEIQVAGYIPILAHPERYPFWYNKFEEYYRFKEAGVLLQLNTNSLTGYYGPEAKKIAERMVNENMIDFIGSDMHGTRHMESLERCVNEKFLWKLAAQGMKNSSLR